MAAEEVLQLVVGFEEVDDVEGGDWGELGEGAEELEGEVGAHYRVVWGDECNSNSLCLKRQSRQHHQQLQKVLTLVPPLNDPPTHLLHHLQKSLRLHHLPSNIDHSHVSSHSELLELLQEGHGVVLGEGFVDEFEEF